MTIQQAIKQVGVGGRVRRECWYHEATITVHGSYLHDDGKNSAFTPTYEMILADDWEVVESKPVFEVGNKVSVSDVVEGSLLACEIVSVNDDLQRATVKPTCTLDVGMEKLILDKPTTFNTRDIEPPVIEVGDVIEYENDSNYWTVLAITDVELIAMDSQGNGKSTFIDNLSTFTIISKGPNVYEFGTVEIKDDRYMQINTNYPMPPNGNYLLTATEDKP